MEMEGRGSSVGARPYWQGLAGLGFTATAAFIIYFILLEII